MNSFLVTDYNAIREDVNTTVRYKLYPSYKQVLAAKKDLRPPMEPVDEAGSDAICAMQPLLNHTVSRTLMIPNYRKKVLEAESKSVEVLRPFQYICYVKVGTDGFTGLPQYNQRLENELQTDGKVISSQLIVMQIVARDLDPRDDMILYTNPLLNSADACRPLR